MTNKNTVTPAKYTGSEILAGVNWNDIQDPTDKLLWDRMTSAFWLPEKFAMSNDLPSWKSMSEAEQTTVLRVFTGLTLLDTIQATVGAIKMIPHALTQHEEANYTFISAMESIHARSYSYIFMTLASTPEIDEAFEWSHANEQLQYKASRIMQFYREGDPLRMKAASVMLESFLFFTGFYVALRFSAEGKITNTADIIRMILTDESFHGYFIGHKFKVGREKLTAAEREALDSEVLELALDLYENELKYTSQLYDDIGWTEDVNAYVRLNCNKAMMNLGYEGFFPAEDTKCHPGVMTALDPGKSENHDFFSGAGSSYFMATAEATEDSDWSW